MYHVKRIFKTLQGEGFWAGRPAVFCRFVGCNMWTGYEQDRERDAERSGADCPLWCDTEFTKEGAARYNAEELAGAIREEGGPVDFCVLTGGEPLLQVDAELIRALHAEGFHVAVETNGTVALEERCLDEGTGEIVGPDWIVCSPKLGEEHLALERCHELKLVVPDYRPEAYGRFAERVAWQESGGRRWRPLWLQPEDGPRQAEATREAIELALAHPDWRVSVQTHKVIGID